MNERKYDQGDLIEVLGKYQLRAEEKSKEVEKKTAELRAAKAELHELTTIHQALVESRQGVATLTFNTLEEAIAHLMEEMRVYCVTIKSIHECLHDPFYRYQVRNIVSLHDDGYPTLGAVYGAVKRGCQSYSGKVLKYRERSARYPAAAVLE